MEAPPADQPEQEMLGSLEGPPQDGTEDTGKPHFLATVAGALSTETEGGLSWGHEGEGVPKGGGRKKTLWGLPHPSTSCPARGASAAAHPSPSPIPPLRSAEDQRDTEDHLLPASLHGRAERRKSCTPAAGRDG